MSSVVVFGAGAFGGWIALALARGGAQVTLVDAWGPGNARASSGGETRLIRAAYGARHHYTDLAVRALPRWRELERRAGRPLFSRTGVLWICDGAAAHFARASEEALAAAGMPFEELSPAAAAARYPQIDFSGVGMVLFEPEAGYLLARRACVDVCALVAAEGGAYRTAAARGPVDVPGDPVTRVPLQDGTTLEADAWVFACGPWLAELFPDILGTSITPTRQEVHYFGTPAGDCRFTEPQLPAWIDVGARPVYGIPGNAGRGFKIADDTPGPSIDPTGLERAATPESIAAARAFLARRFPVLAGAPLLGTEVCQYEATPDAELVIDRHPRASNVWIAGGGSGHGFKLAPAVGDLVASHVLDGTAPDPRFAIARFAGPPAGGWRAKWV